MRETGLTPTLPKCLVPNSTWGLMALMSLSLCACGANNRVSTSAATTTDCVLDPEQGGTLSGRWLKTAVPIAFQNGAFSGTELQAMITAAKNWNSFFAASMGYPAIDYGTDQSPRMSTVPIPANSSTFCSSQFIIDMQGGYGFTTGGMVVIYKDTSWPSSYGSAIIALTTTCRQSASNRKIPFFSNAFMEINYQNFFVSSRVPDLQSIVLHEMGHLMGINHSCEMGSTQTGVPDCNEAALPTLYRTASMYPTFSFYTSGMGEVRQTLNLNDQGRMNCVYKFL